MSEQFIKVNNEEIWTLTKGKGIPVLFINGGPGTCNYLEPVSDLIDDVCKVIMFEPRGCGRSTYDGNGYDLNACLYDMERIRQHYGIRKWIVIGHSWGADLGLAYALLYPQSLLAYVSISSTGIQNDRDWKEVYKRNLERFGENQPNFQFPHNKLVHRSLIDSWRTFIKNPNILKGISNITIPSLFIYGENDIHPAWPIKQVANLIHNSWYIEIKEAEHYIWLDKKEELREILQAFIEGKVITLEK